MPKLLMVTTVAVTVKSFLLPFARALRDEGWQVDALASGISAERDCRDTFDNVWEAEWSRRPWDPRNFTSMPRRIRRLVDSQEYDIIHVHTPVAGFVTRFALRTSPRPKIVYTAHGFHFHQLGSPVMNAIYRRLETIAGDWTDALVVINREDERTAAGMELVPLNAIHYMPGIGVDTQRYSRSSLDWAEVSSLRSSIGIEANGAMILCVAEFISRKRHADLLHAFSLLDRPGTHLVLAGNGPLLEAMKALAAELRISKNVHFLGYRSDVPLLIAAASVVVLVSEQEGLPRSLMEAMSLEVPVIGTDIRGTGELVEDAGISVPIGDREKLAHALDWVLGHKDEALELGRRGRAKILDQYDEGNVIDLHRELYQQLLVDD